MKKILLGSLFLLVLNSCYVHKTVVGEGAQQGLTVKATQHNFIGGLISGKTPDTQLLAGGATDYEVVIKHSFLDGLLSFITSGIYNPTTVEVKR
ncbi:MAG: hypothetical protein RLZZ242_1164 [Bacteroidota bacterium]|jgi:hypothetical protein